MNNYAEDKKVLDNIADRYVYPENLIMRVAIQYIIEWGQEIFQKGDYSDRIKELTHDHYYEAVFNCAKELSAINPYHLIIYMQKSMYWSEEGGMNIDRATRLLIKLMKWIDERASLSDMETYEIFQNCNFTDEELETLNFGYLRGNE